MQRCNDTSGFRRFPWGREYFNRGRFEIIPTLDKFILPCGTKFVRVQFFAVFPAICKNKLPQIKFTANIFPEKFNSRANILQSEFATEKYSSKKSSVRPGPYEIRRRTFLKLYLKYNKVQSGTRSDWKTWHYCHPIQFPALAMGCYSCSLFFSDVA